MSANVALLERMFLGLWNERDMDHMMELMLPAYVLCDHRPLHMSGSSRDDWRELMEGWWQLVPDIRCTDLSVIATAPQVVACTLRFEGNDSVTGGQFETVLSVATRFEGDRICEAHVFHDAAEASSYFATRS